MLRLREVEQHLTPTQRAELADILYHQAAAPEPPTAPSDPPRISLLREYGLLPPDAVVPEVLPEPPVPPLTACTFRCEASAQDVHLICEGEQSGDLLRVTLLRTPPEYRADIDAAASVFTAIQRDLSASVALEAAQVWAALHGSRPLPWERLAVSPDEAPVPSPTLTVLPPRRRGRGQFRLPG